MSINPVCPSCRVNLHSVTVIEIRSQPTILFYSGEAELYENKGNISTQNLPKREVKFCCSKCKKEYSPKEVHIVDQRFGVAGLVTDFVYLSCQIFSKGYSEDRGEVIIDLLHKTTIDKYIEGLKEQYNIKNITRSPLKELKVK